MDVSFWDSSMMHCTVSINLSRTSKWRIIMFVHWDLHFVGNSSTRPTIVVQRKVGNKYPRTGVQSGHNQLIGHMPHSVGPKKQTKIGNQGWTEAPNFHSS